MRYCALTFWYLVVIGIGVSPASEQSVAAVGESGKWEVFWHRISITETGAYQLHRACPVLASALKAAKAEDFNSFCASFWDVKTNDPPLQVKTWYDEWRRWSKAYGFLLVAEGALVDMQPQLSNGLCCMSFAPVAERGFFPGMLTNVPPRKEQVVFARQVAGQWKLTHHVPDKKMYDYLRACASLVVYPPGSPESVEAGHILTLQGMQERGASPESIAVQKEVFRLGNQGLTVNTWEKWTNQYHACILDPPVVFDLRDPVTNDFTTPVAALRSYWRAIYAGDAKTLLKNCDDNARVWLTGHLKVDEKIKRATYTVFTNITRVTVLLIATNTLEGQTYVLVFSRAQEAADPKNGRVAFRTEIFRRAEDGKYFYNRDLLFSPFGMVEGAAKADGANLLPYREFYEIVKHSQFPPHFYTIE